MLSIKLNGFYKSAVFIRVIISLPSI